MTANFQRLKRSTALRLRLDYSPSLLLFSLRSYYSRESQYARTTIPTLQARKLGEQGTRGNRRLLYYRRNRNPSRKYIHSQEARGEESEIPEVSVLGPCVCDNERGCFVVFYSCA
ncbi:hypothetical protein HOY82DRAFT_578459 [Tuber indicum]|nr:hypothetical protein HOY82DRAFT_578459 [Tuber indicum]